MLPDVFVERKKYPKTALVWLVEKETFIEFVALGSAPFTSCVLPTLVHSFLTYRMTTLAFFTLLKLYEKITMLRAYHSFSFF